MLLKSVKIYCVQTHFYTQTVHRNTPAGHDCYWVQRVKGLQMQLNTKSLINGKANPGKRFCDWNSLGISAVENRKKNPKPGKY